MRMAILLGMVILLSGVALAYFQDGWESIGTDPSSTPFRVDTNPKNCGWMEDGDPCTFSWTVDTTARGKYPVRVEFYSDFADVQTNATDAENVTVFLKGEDETGRIPREIECTNGGGCAFTIPDGSVNPVECGTLSDGSSCPASSVNWTVTAHGPEGVEWDIYVNFTYNSTAYLYPENVTAKRKVRVVEHKWWNTSWNCRRKISFFPNETTTGLIVIRGFKPVDLESVSQVPCMPMNCTKELRVTEVLDDGSQSLTENLTVENPTHVRYSEYTYCKDATIKFNSSITSGKEKTLFVYYKSGLAEDDYNRTSSGISEAYNRSFSDVNKTSFERSWYAYYDAHVDFWWQNSTDGNETGDGCCNPGGSSTFRNNSERASDALRNRSYFPQVDWNRGEDDTQRNLENTTVFVFYGHGSIQNDSGTANETLLKVSGGANTGDLLSTVIDDLPLSKIKFVYSISSFGADNGTSMGCLSNPGSTWLSKAFTEAGADCYLGFFGNDYNENQFCDNDDSDVLYGQTEQFGICFWDEIKKGETITDAKSVGDDCISTCGSGKNESCTNPNLVERVAGSCDITL